MVEMALGSGLHASQASLSPIVGTCLNVKDYCNALETHFLPYKSERWQI